MEETIKHFTSKKNFEKIISDKYFVAFYNKEEISSDLRQNANEGEKYYYIPMVCFSDTDVDIENHINEYGEVCICFSKDWAIRKNIIPVMYIHRDTNISEKIKKLFEYFELKYIHANEENRVKVLKEFNHLFHISLFIKPYEGTSSKNNKQKNFYLEREWRFIPDIEHMVEYTSLQDVINNLYEKVIKQNQYHLDFNINDIVEIKTDEINLPSLKKFINDNKIPLADKIHKFENL